MIGSPLLIAQKVRARLKAAVEASRSGEPIVGVPAASPMPNPGDLVITACEVNSMHGTGTLLLRYFPDTSSIVSLRTHNFYEGVQPFGAAQLCLPVASFRRGEIGAWLRWQLGDAIVRRILCLPYTPAEALTALAAKDVCGAPMCTYIMDDKNVCADGISDDLMRELLEASHLRLVISPEMRDAYSAKYGMRFWVMPPLVPSDIIRRDVIPLPGNANRGVVLGNLWDQSWLLLLREVFRGGHISIDWYCNQKEPVWLTIDRAGLAADGVFMKDPIDEEELPEVLGKYPFAVVPSDRLTDESPAPVRAIAELSLPSRMVTIMATANLPMLVLGSPSTCAAAFVRRFGLGEVAPYEQHAVLAAIARLSSPGAQSEIRRRAAALAGRFSADGAAEWIWRSLDAGAAVTSDYEEMMPRSEVQVET
jgi:hypothetical protein